MWKAYNDDPFGINAPNIKGTTPFIILAYKYKKFASQKDDTKKESCWKLLKKMEANGGQVDLKNKEGVSVRSLVNLNDNPIQTTEKSQKSNPNLINVPTSTPKTSRPNPIRARNEKDAILKSSQGAPVNTAVQINLDVTNKTTSSQNNNSQVINAPTYVSVSEVLSENSLKPEQTISETKRPDIHDADQST